MAKKTFEDALKKLDEITQDLESGDLSLEASLKKFEEGIQLARFCNSKLDECQQRVSLLLEKNGSLTESPFEESSNGS
ncbi:MAG: exodeoxyribonuclease VII small subunit [Desulfurivibrionaceae bacterium]|nr:exodeoxyribonuclease VII small subunit [Desulfurivibrionaceae bacterium]